jgi:hypothetical protein
MPSCKKEKTDAPNVHLIGKWKFKEYSTFDRYVVETRVEGNDFKFRCCILFNEDNYWFTSSFGEYKINGEIITFITRNTPSTNLYKYFLEENGVLKMVEKNLW